MDEHGQVAGGLLTSGEQEVGCCFFFCGFISGGVDASWASICPLQVKPSNSRYKYTLTRLLFGNM